MISTANDNTSNVGSYWASRNVGGTVFVSSAAQHGGGTSGGGDGMGVWQAGVDRQLGELRTDIKEVRDERRWILGGLAGLAVILGGGGFTLYTKLADEQTLTSQRAQEISGEVKVLSEKIEGKLALIDEKLSAKKR